MLTKISLQSYNIYRRFSKPILNMLTCMSVRVAVYIRGNIITLPLDLCILIIGVMIPHILRFPIQHVVVFVVLLVLWMCNDGSYKLNSSVAIFSSVVRTQNIPLLANIIILCATQTNIHSNSYYGSNGYRMIWPAAERRQRLLRSRSRWSRGWWLWWDDMTPRRVTS